jgi:hypothetical protein
MSLVAYKENEPSQFRLGAVHSLHPNQVVIVELMYTFSRYQASNIHIYNIEKEYPRFTAYYLNVIDESFVASDGCISSSPDRPCSIKVLHLNTSLIPKKLPPLYCMRNIVIPNNNICPMPPFYKSNHSK